MPIARRTALLLLLAASLAWPPAQATAAGEPGQALRVVRAWYGLALELVRHTPTYSPPVASRTLAYLGIAAYEARIGGSADLVSLAGQLDGLSPGPLRSAGQAYDEAAVQQAVLAAVVRELFANTGPTGQRAIERLEARLRAELAGRLPADEQGRSEAHGRAVAAHVLDWARRDGGAEIENLGFPASYTLKDGPAHWRPTSLVSLQQTPLLPGWGGNRPFAMPAVTACPLPPPPSYSEEPGSAFHRQASEVLEASRNLSAEQVAIARFWADDAMLSMTPPGHWVSITLQVLEADAADLDLSLEALARLGIALGDAFIGCWHAKYEFDLVRPVTYIRKVLDPRWEALLTTPPFPEYPSGHSTMSAAAAVVLGRLLGERHAFVDATRRHEGLAPRSFPSFEAAAQEAGISRLYGGIHFRAAIERGLEQGRCIGAFAAGLRMRR